MPLYFVYTMVQKSQKWPKTQIKGVLPDNFLIFFLSLNNPGFLPLTPPHRNAARQVAIYFFCNPVWINGSESDCNKIRHGCPI